MSKESFEYTESNNPEAGEPNLNKELLKECLRDHVVDVRPSWYGSEQLKRGVSGGLVGAAETHINRCDPPLEIKKAVMFGGKSVALIGPNGAGKSTFFDAIMEKTKFYDGVHGYNKGVHGKESMRIARLNQEELLGNLEEVEVEEVLDLVCENFKNDFPVEWSAPGYMIKIY